MSNVRVIFYSSTNAAYICCISDTIKKGLAGNRTQATCSRYKPKASIVPLDYKALSNLGWYKQHVVSHSIDTASCQSQLISTLLSDPYFQVICYEVHNKCLMWNK
jgi:hypothetical protein